MELLTTVTILLLWLILFVLPILLYKIFTNRKCGFTLFLITSLIIGGGVIILAAWWSNYSDLLLLEHYGYNIDGMNHEEFYGNVATENLQKVQELERSISGVGWQVKAVLFYPYYILSVLFMFLIMRLVKKYFKKNR